MSSWSPAKDRWASRASAWPSFQVANFGLVARPLDENPSAVDGVKRVAIDKAVEQGCASDVLFHPPLSTSQQYPACDAGAFVWSSRECATQSVERVVDRPFPERCDKLPQPRRVIAGLIRVGNAAVRFGELLQITKATMGNQRDRFLGADRVLKTNRTKRHD